MNDLRQKKIDTFYVTYSKGRVGQKYVIKFFVTKGRSHSKKIKKSVNFHTFGPPPPKKCEI